MISDFKKIVFSMIALALLSACGDAGGGGKKGVVSERPIVPGPSKPADPGAGNSEIVDDEEEGQPPIEHDVTTYTSFARCAGDSVVEFFWNALDENDRIVMVRMDSQNRGEVVLQSFAVMKRERNAAGQLEVLVNQKRHPEGIYEGFNVRLKKGRDLKTTFYRASESIGDFSCTFL